MRFKLLLLSAAFLLNACVENLNMDLDVRGIPVVNCILKNDTVQTLSITMSIGLKDKYIYEEIENARATLYVNGYKIDTFKQGAGLGLSVCKTILEGMDGQITVSSQLGKGSRFTIKIPLKPQEKMNLQNHEQQ